MSLLCVLTTWPHNTKLGDGVGYVSVLFIKYMATQYIVRLESRLCLCCVY
jgi:hypothetical protein